MVSARPSPARSAYKQQSLVLAEVKAFDRASLRHVEATRVTDLGGSVRMEVNQRLQVRRRRRPAGCRRGGAWLDGWLAVPRECTMLCSMLVCLARERACPHAALPHPAPRCPSPRPLQAEPGAEVEAEALRALAALRLRSKHDSLPARVAPGLFIGAAGAARNLKALRKRGITHIVNAAPAVPCHFRDNPEGAFEYLALPLFDDPDAGAGLWGCWVPLVAAGCCWGCWVPQGRWCMGAGGLSIGA